MFHLTGAQAIFDVHSRRKDPLSSLDFMESLLDSLMNECSRHQVDKKGKRHRNIIFEIKKLKI